MYGENGLLFRSSLFYQSQYHRLVLVDFQILGILFLG